MKRSVEKILTTHVGSLPNLFPLESGDGQAEDKLPEAVAAVVAKQRGIGLDVINEGEYTRGGDWLSYVEDRFAGFEARPPEGGKPLIPRAEVRLTLKSGTAS